jgi:hypothetical protein
VLHKKTYVTAWYAERYVCGRSYSIYPTIVMYGTV